MAVPFYNDNPPIIEPRQASPKWSSRELLEKQMNVLASRLVELENRPEEPEGDPCIIFFERSFGGNEKKYTYAGIRVNRTGARYSRAKWYLTGYQNLSFSSWDDLLDWMGNDVDQIWQVTDLQEV